MNLERLRRLKLSPLLLILCCLAAIGGAGWAVRGYLSSRHARIAPPEVALEGIDPQVAQLIRSAQSEVAAAPDSAAAWGKLGEVLTANDYFHQAALSFQQAERLDAKDPRWPYLCARALQEETPQAALPELRRAVELAGDRTSVPGLTLAEFLLRGGDLNAAAPLLQNILENNPHDPRALLDLGRVQLARGQLQQARQSLTDSINMAPQIKACHVLLAQVQQRLGDAASAELSLRDAADLPENASWPDPFAAELNQYKVGERGDVDRARNLLNAGRNRELVEFVEPLTRRYPRNFETWEMLGVGLGRLSRFAEAETALRTASRVAPDSLRVSVDLIVVMGLQQQYEQVQALCRKTIDRHPDAAEPHYFLGAAMARQQNWDAAIAELKTAVRLRPDLVNCRVGLGEALLKSGQRDEAAVELRQALRLCPDDANARELLARAIAAGAH